MELEIMKNMDAAAHFGSTYGQDVEPHGTYVLQRDHGRDLFPGWVGGKASLKKPLFIDLDKYENVIDYKRDLATQYKAKGKALTKKLMAKGYDAIITQTKKYGSEEIVLFPNANFVLYQPQQEMRKRIKQLVRENLNEGVYEDNLKRLFHGQQKENGVSGLTVNSEDL